MADYPISNVARRVVYANTGVGPYAFTFEILANTDIAVYRGSTLLTLTTDYSVTINANGTGSVTLVTAGTGNITIVGARAIQRTSDYTTGGDLFASTLNTDLDSLTIYTQQVAETAERGLKAPVVDPTDINMTLPAKATRAGTVLAFDSPSGNPVAGPTIASVGTVTGNIANINTVAGSISNVNTVATNISNVNTVAGISGNVTTVANNNANITTVADDLNEPVSEINTVAVNIANVNAVGNFIGNVNTVAGISASVNTVAGIAANVITVAGISADVTTVADISADVTLAAGIDQADLSAVADISSEITTVANNSANVTTVANSIANVNTNATNIASINQNAANINAIQTASANATAAANSATAAASSATSASASAAAASAVALGNEPVRHSVRPSLLLDFANTKTLDPRITFTRASTATFYDGKTVAKAEENLLTYSQEFDNTTGWTIAGSLGLTRSANTSTAPDGTTTADTITEDSTLNGHFLASATVSTSGQITLSVFAKLGSGSRYLTIGVSADGTSHASATFDLSAGSNTQTQANGSYSSASATITAVAQSFYRCTLTVTTTTVALVRIGMNNTSTPTTAQRGFGATYTGDGTSSIILWGAQLEQRSSVTAYTATTTAPITNYIPALQTAASGVARFEHNPVTGESLGLEIEEQRTNLYTYSEDFSNAAWSKIRSSISSNVIVAPDGTLTGDKLVEDTTASNTHQVQQTVAATSGTAYTITTHIKAGERTWAALRFASTNSVFADDYVYFNLTAGTVGTTDADITASITPVGNGWYRCRATRTALATANGVFAINVVTADNTITHTGDGYSGIYIWGAQLEAGSFATSYIPTVASQVTRSADSASMTGTNFSSWYRADEGTLYVENFRASSSRGSVIIDDGTSTNYIGISDNINNTSSGAVLNGNTIQASLLYGSNTNSFEKKALVYKVNDFAGSRNAGTVLTDTAGTIPVVNILRLGIAGGGPGMAYYKKIAYYPLRLTNSEIQSLTTV